jgi:hypothetical protein
VYLLATAAVIVGLISMLVSKYPAAEPGALIDEPLEAAVGSLTRPAEEVSR